MIRKFLIVIITMLGITESNAQREVINLNQEWDFTREGTNQSQAITVNLPHTWNYDALSGDSDYYRGVGNYVKKIEVPKEWLDKKVFLRFRGANQKTTMFINSQYLGEHNGGYTAFGWDITHLLSQGTNYIWARVNNALDLNTMPLVGQFNVYGGIYRDVELIVTPKTHISMEECATDGLFVTTTISSERYAKVKLEATVTVEPLKETEVMFAIYDNMGEMIDHQTKKLKQNSQSDQKLSTEFSIADPNLWNSTQNPYLYRASLITIVDDVTTDSISENFGLRYWQVNADNEFMLNGSVLQIRGVTRHQDNAILANAIYPVNHQRDIELMREMGVNAVRLTYYPQDAYFIELCDKAGIMVWSEIPFVGSGGIRGKGFIDSEQFMDNGREQLKEMVTQLYNHPSILWWGMFNELSQRGDDPKIYIRDLVEYCKELDPSRTTVAASNQDGELNFLSELIGFNQTLGWESGAPGDIEVWAKSLRRNWPELKVGLSEYGAGGSNYQHTDQLVRPVVNSYWHPECWQTHFHECYWKIIDQGKYFWGTFINSMFDYGVSSLRNGQRRGISDLGLVTFDRLIKKDAFYYYKANWNSDDMFVHIAQGSWIERDNPVQQIKIFSNCPAVELIVNGQSLGVVYNDGYGTFLWNDVTLNMGDNQITAHSVELSESDQCSVRIQ
ncbi:MAG: glycoside hydrolase family 2 TIM barrel-domain containing protein [Rikenellaceae bacterium]